MPADIDPGMAFVLVQHLAPDHKSILSDIIRSYTRMQVFEVEDGMKVMPNCAYIIPPNHDMAFLNGMLHLLEPSVPRGQRLPIDFFFRSLAQDQHERAICIVLSGTGSDGTLGLRAIKGEGGMVIVQDPDSTKHDGMPRSAIATGMVDYVLPVAEMPKQLMDYVTHAFGTKVADLSRLNNDMNNMLTSTGIATVFVDLQLRILRFTPTATEIINLILSDVGRPVAHLVSNLVGYDNMVTDVQTVLSTLIHKEMEVQTKEGKWYIMRIRPYRTTENVIEGAVITFVDITQMKSVKDALTVSEMRFRRLFESAKHGILILDASTGKIVEVNKFLVDMLGYSEEQFTKRSIWDLGFFHDIIANKDKFIELQEEEYVRYSDLPLETADGRRIEVEFISSVYLVNDHKVIQCDIRELAAGQGKKAGMETRAIHHEKQGQPPHTAGTAPEG